jgi:hypothetical protein
LEYFIISVITALDLSILSVIFPWAYSIEILLKAVVEAVDASLLICRCRLMD